MSLFSVMAIALLVALSTFSLVILARPSIDLQGNDPGAAVLRAYAVRARWFRRLGVLIGVFLAVEVGVIWYRRVGFSLGQTSLFGDILAMPMLVSLATGVIAETYNVRKNYRGARVADLVDRTERYRGESEANRFRLASGMSVTVAVTGWAVRRSGIAASLIVVALVSVAIVEVTQRFVAMRARPKLPLELEAADDAIRRVASQRLDRSGLGIAILMTGWAAMPLLAGGRWVAAGLGWAALIAAFAVWRSVGRMIP
jgi:hypothetical protein